MSEIQVPWFQGEWLGFDTETTGVNPERDRIATASLIRRADGQNQVRNWVVNPGVPMPPGASAVNGLTDAYLEEHGEQPAVALDEIACELADAMGRGIPAVGFNVSFDFGILENELMRYQLPTIRQRLGGKLVPIIDPLVLDRALDRYRKGKRKLASVCEAYKLGTDCDFHQADSDVAATLDLLEAIIRRFPQLQQMDLTQLHEFQVESYRVWAENFNAFMSQKLPDFRPNSVTWFFA